jgi:hypothetical protein
LELRGNLKDFGLSDIIQLVGFGKKTGVLRVDCGEGGAALYFDDGNVVHAEFPGLEGESAVFRLFHELQGEFQFQTDTASRKRTIAMHPTNLVMEAARLLDEAHRTDPPQPCGESGSEWFPPVPTSDPAALKREIKEVLQRRFGRSAKRLLQAVDRCGNSMEDLLELAQRLERYVHVFLDTGVSRAVGQEIRELVTASF